MKRRIICIALAFMFAVASVPVALVPMAANAAGADRMRAAYSAYYDHLMGVSVAPDPNPYSVNYDAAFEAWISRMESGLPAGLGMYYAELVYFGDSDLPQLLYVVDSGYGPDCYVSNAFVYGYSSRLDDYSGDYGYFIGGDNGYGEVRIATDRGGVSYLNHYVSTWDIIERDDGGFDEGEHISSTFYALSNGRWAEAPESGIDIVETRTVGIYAPSSVNNVLTELRWLQSNPWEPLGNYPADWAITEVSSAVAANLVPHSISDGGWQYATSRLDAADAIVLLIENSSGRAMEAIAAERGWDLNTNQFSDSISHSVTFLKYAGVTTGVGNNMYDPGGVFNRAQIVTMIGRAAEVFFGASARGDNPFADVPDWAAPYVGYAAANGITQGVSSDRFDPDGILQNQHTAIFCYRAFAVFTQRGIRPEG